MVSWGGASSLRTCILSQRYGINLCAGNSDLGDVSNLTWNFHYRVLVECRFKTPAVIVSDRSTYEREVGACTGRECYIIHVVSPK